MTFIVTGAAGFIGSNLVRALNERGERDVIAVDNLTQADKATNLADCEISDYVDKEDFLERLAAGGFGTIRALFHQGACSDTMEHNGRYMMENNYTYSCRVLEACLAQRIPLLYASSAAVYGRGPRFAEEPECERPLNVYGYSKLLFDQRVRRVLADSPATPVAGFRYFNVYGPREAHKGRMASVAYHHVLQYRADGRVRLFGAWDGWAEGAQQRDFVSIEDVVAANCHFLEHPRSGIYNLGTGRAQSFNELACAVIGSLDPSLGSQSLSAERLHQMGRIEYVPFPDALKGKYQSFTQADMARLREAGYTRPFLDVAEGVRRYCEWLVKKDT